MLRLLSNNADNALIAGNEKMINAERKTSNVECSFLTNQRPLFDVLFRPLPFGTDNHRKHFREKTREFSIYRERASLECQPAFDFH